MPKSYMIVVVYNVVVRNGIADILGDFSGISGDMLILSMLT